MYDMNRLLNLISYEDLVQADLDSLATDEYPTDDDLDELDEIRAIERANRARES
tara:strand:- start:1135 stop:1296 length:162 start_codon:yes stop_codon:yes gene_type:complete